MQTRTHPLLMVLEHSSYVLGPFHSRLLVSAHVVFDTKDFAGQHSGPPPCHPRDPSLCCRQFQTGHFHTRIPDVLKGGEEGGGRCPPASCSLTSCFSTSFQSGSRSPAWSCGVFITCQKLPRVTGNNGSSLQPWAATHSCSVP